jgi:hypothetical protein
MASPEVSSGMMISPEVFRELTAVPFITTTLPANRDNLLFHSKMKNIVLCT